MSDEMIGKRDQMSQDDNLPHIYVVSITDLPDGTAHVQLEVSDEFVALFKEHYGIEEWDRDKFQSWFVAALDETVARKKLGK